jgi:hypothetical protein
MAAMPLMVPRTRATTGTRAATATRDVDAVACEMCARAVERGIAELVAHFEQMPDLFLRPADLHGALFNLLQRQEHLVTPYPTQDGRQTALLHREYPAMFAGDGMGHGPRSYDIAVLNPGFVVNHDLKMVANLNGQGRVALEHLDGAQRPVPLLAAVSLRLIEGYTPETRDELETALTELVHAGADAERRYLAVFIRHWELEDHIHKALELLEHWARNQRHLSLVVVQSYYDDVGRVFGGRYLNVWSHMAPLPPLDPGYCAAPRPNMSRPYACF